MGYELSEPWASVCNFSRSDTSDFTENTTLSKFVKVQQLNDIQYYATSQR